MKFGYIYIYPSSVKLCGTVSFDTGVTQIHVFTDVTLCWIVTVQDCMTLKVKVLRSFQMLVTIYQSTQNLQLQVIYLLYYAVFT